uniref:Monoacylglycerol lipase ABHD6 n=2 Tax=Cajanus cajan TaxID=3821 RepID=A0A151RSV9_CAJCA|nr:Monoacylglycerol lipase ABHD6 [Cajanus cajan]
MFMYTGHIRRAFTGAGLLSQTLRVDEETTMHFWGPKSEMAEKGYLVLIHGFGPSATWQWRRQVKFLAPHFNVYVPDLVFFGGSTTKSRERSEVFQAESVGKLVDKLGVHKFHVVGTSYGGIVAYNLAKILGEDRVHKVVLASSGLNMTISSNVHMVHAAQFNNIEELMLPSTPQHLRKLMSLSIHKPAQRVPDFILKDFLDELYGENRKEKVELLNGITIGRDQTSHISPLSQEVLIVWGDQDKIFPVQLAYELKEIICENAKLELIKDASHMPQMEKPREFNNILLKFLQEHS